MNTIPKDTAIAIQNSFQDALKNKEKSFQHFTDIYKGNTYHETIERTCYIEYDKLNKHEISRFYIDERSSKGIIRRAFLDNVKYIDIDENSTFLIIGAQPYNLCIEITKEEPQP